MTHPNSVVVVISRENWEELPAVGHAANRRSAKFLCPTCDETLSLYNHDVLSSGQVVPNVKCPNCSFHNEIRLEGWE